MFNGSICYVLYLQILRFNLGRRTVECINLFKTKAILEFRTVSYRLNDNVLDLTFIAFRRHLASYRSGGDIRARMASSKLPLSSLFKSEIRSWKRRWANNYDLSVHACIGLHSEPRWMDTSGSNRYNIRPQSNYLSVTSLFSISFDIS